MTDEQKAKYVAALLRERDHAARAGNENAVEQVTAELRRIGAEAAPPPKRAQRRPRKRMEER